MLNVYLKAAAIGIVAGMRSASAPALVSDHLARKGGNALDGSPLAWMASPTTATVTKVLAAGELVGDKLPFTPSRLAPGPLGGRMASGALCGAVLCASERERAEVGAVVGALAAALGAWAFYHLRQSADRATGLPDPVVAVVEDALAVGGGWYALQK